MPSKIDWEALAGEQRYHDADDMLEDFYLRQGWSSIKIAEKLNVSPTAVYAKLKALGIPRRKSSCNCGEWRKGMRGIFIK